MGHIVQHPRAPVTFDPNYMASEASIARAKEEAAKERAEAAEAMKAAELERGAAILLITELMETYSAATVHRWVTNIAYGMGQVVCK